MRIVLDIRYRTRSGAASYIDNIVPGLTRSPGQHEFLLLRGHDQVIPPGTDCECVELRNDSAAGQVAYDQVRLPRLLRRLGADVYHPLKHLGTLFSPCPQVTTAHSITLPFRGHFPVGRAAGLYWNVIGSQMLRRSTAIIAVSEYVRDFLVNVVRVGPERITVIYHGVDPRFRRLAAVGETLPSGDSPYLLTVGNIFPVKNFAVAVQVLAALSKEFPRLRLKMAGATTHTYARRVRSIADANALMDRIDLIGFAPPERLVELMNGASVLLMPSLTEGFALTVLEAMACGTPVVASARGAIPEVGADAVSLVEDPSDVNTWASVTADLLRNDNKRQQLADRALRRAARFDWATAVARTRSVYESLTRTQAAT